MKKGNSLLKTEVKKTLIVNQMTKPVGKRQATLRVAGTTVAMTEDAGVLDSVQSAEEAQDELKKANVELERKLEAKKKLRQLRTSAIATGQAQMATQATMTAQKLEAEAKKKKQGAHWVIVLKLARRSAIFNSRDVRARMDAILTAEKAAASTRLIAAAVATSTERLA